MTYNEKYGAEHSNEYNVNDHAKEIESKLMNITDNLLGLSPLRYKMTPWIIGRATEAYFTWLFSPWYLMQSALPSGSKVSDE